MNIVKSNRPVDVWEQILENFWLRNQNGLVKG